MTNIGGLIRDRDKRKLKETDRGRKWDNGESETDRQTALKWFQWFIAHWNYRSANGMSTSDADVLDLVFFCFCKFCNVKCPIQTTAKQKSSNSPIRLLSSSQPV